MWSQVSGNISTTRASHWVEGTERLLAGPDHLLQRLGLRCLLAAPVEPCGKWGGAVPSGNNAVAWRRKKDARQTKSTCFFIFSFSVEKTKIQQWPTQSLVATIWWPQISYPKISFHCIMLSAGSTSWFYRWEKWDPAKVVQFLTNYVTLGNFVISFFASKISKTILTSLNYVKD